MNKYIVFQNYDVSLPPQTERTVWVKLRKMTTLQMIYFICTHPELTNIVIGAYDDSTPMQAIERLSGIDTKMTWYMRIENRYTLLIW